MLRRRKRIFSPLVADAYRTDRSLQQLNKARQSILLRSAQDTCVPLPQFVNCFDKSESGPSLTFLPCFQTPLIVLVLPMLVDGSLSSTMKLAFFSGSRVPHRSSIFSSCAPFFVATVIACIGVNPAFTRSSSSMCSEKPWTRTG